MARKTEKFLLYGGAIQQAGTVKGKKNSRHATSDWMEIEKQRGISVTSSVLQFNYDGFCINILDTPGHQDFSEDTYRTLMAADCAVMVIDDYPCVIRCNGLFINNYIFPCKTCNFSNTH